ncbi:MAG: DUF2807 domain-containing protein [Chlorobi bacterium]|nr:DUF2807 domain-containing protein [Chlorobiota bacterium]
MNKKNLAFTIFSLIFFVASPLFAQVTGKGKVVRQVWQVGTFHGVNAHGAQDVVLINGDSCSLEIETNADLFQYIKTSISNGVLRVDFNKIKRYDVMKFYITAPVFDRLIVSGASDVRGKDTLRGDNLVITVSGASDTRLNLKYKSVVSRVSGASDLILSGYATSHVIDARGASEVKARNFVTQTTVVTASGSSSCFVNASGSLTYQVSGASTVRYSEKPKTLIIQNKNKTQNMVFLNDSVKRTSADYNYYADTTNVNIGGLHVEVIDSDTTKITVGNNTLIVDEDGNVKFRRSKKIRFNGHWGGVQLGINGYVTPDFNTNFGKDYDYLSLRYEKSIAVNLNIYEQNIPLNKAKNMGLVTGLGLAWNNYRFTHPTYLSPDSSRVYGFYIEGASVRKSKLTAMYITLPLMWEIQTKNNRRIKQFHFGIGVLMSARVRTHTKLYFNQANQPYKLQDPVTGTTIPVNPDDYYYTPGANERNIVKNFNSFYLQPFKFDGMIQIGYSVINLYATFGLNPLFQHDRGPFLKTWSAGISLVGW